MNGSISRLLGLLLLTAPAAQAQYGYFTNTDGGIYGYITNAGGGLTIAAYAGPPWVVAIPTNINGLTVTAIAQAAFYFQTNLTSDAIPDSVTSIAEDAFEVCLSLTNVSIPESITSIPDHAFAGAGLASVMIPASVTNIGPFAFACSGLTAMTVEEGNSVYSSLDGVVFDSSGSNLLIYPHGARGSYTIPGNVTNIALEAFFGCVGLTSVTIPGSVASIGGGTFALCYGLTNVTIFNGVVSILNNAFYQCTNLSSVTIPASVTNIGINAFGYCTNLASVTIPASITSLQENSFCACYSLAGVYFLGNAPAADSYVFNLDTNATAYYLPGTTGWSAFSANTGLSAVLWNPLIQTADGSFGVRADQFGFNITGTPNIPIVVQAANNLANPVWTSLQSITLTNGSYYFSEPFQPASPARFYRIASQ